MPQLFRRSVAVVAVAIGLTFAIRDLIGIRDEFPVAPLAHYGFVEHLWGFVRLLALVLAGVIVFKDFKRTGAAILVGALIGLSLNNNWWFLSADNPLLWPSVVLNYLGIGYGVMQFMRFAACYTDVDYRGIRALVSAAAKYFGAALASFGILWAVSAIVDQRPNVVYDRVFWLTWDAANILTILAIVTALRMATNPEARGRITVITWSFCIAAAGTALHGTYRLLTHRDPGFVFGIDTFAQLALVLGLAYGLLRNRLFDKESFSQIATTYGTFTVGLCAGDVLVDRLADHFVPEPRGAASGAAAFGLSVLAVMTYKTFEDWTERRNSDARKSDLAALEKFAREIPHICDAEALEDQLMRVLESNTRAQGVALYRRTENGLLEKVSSTIDNMPGTLEENSAMLGRALPMFGGGSVNGAVFFDGELDAREREPLLDVVTAAGNALDALRARELEQRVRELESKLTTHAL